MSKEAIPFEMLSAYVDGELDAANAARVADAAASNPALATAIARLQGLRASVAAGIPEFVHLPTASVRQAKVRWRRLHRIAIAASVAILLLGGLAVFINQSGEQTPRLAKELAPAVAIHDRWLESSQPAMPLEAVAAVPLDRLLAATGLRLVLKDRTELDDGIEAVHSRFVGERGCRLSFFESVASRSADPERMDIGHDGALRLARWTDGRLAFVVVARDMDPVRFATIAGALREMGSLDAAPPMEELIASLSAARQACLG
jgi:anti-sigma factor RsiW